MKSLVRVCFVVLCLIVVSTIQVRAQTCGGTLSCSTSHPAYSFTNTSGTAVYGAGNFGYGVEGTGPYGGMYGEATSGSGYGVFGENTSSSFGVFGKSQSGTGVQGTAVTSGHYGVYASGNLGASGTKTFVEPYPSDASKEIQYAALEGPEAGTYFRGTARIANGVARIAVPEDFRIVTAESGLTVHVTPIGELALVACTKKDLNEIELQGSKDVEVDFIVHGVRRAFADFRPIVENREFRPSGPNDTEFTVGLPAESLRRLKLNGTLNTDGTVNLETARRAGWDRQSSWSETRPLPQINQN